MEKDFETLLHVFLSPQLDSNVAVSEFVHNVQEATSLNLHLFLQMREAVIGNTTIRDGLIRHVAWRNRPLRFEVVGAENIQKACCHFNDNAWFELEQLREKRAVLQTEFSNLLALLRNLN